MMVAVNQGTMLALRLGRLKDGPGVHPSQISMGKMVNVRSALEVAREARNVLGANGVTLEYPVIRVHERPRERLYLSRAPTRSTR